MIHVVLYEPEIPQNTGNIMRTCMAFGCRLHLIEPLGFYLDESHLRRAGMDYVKELEYEVHSDWDSFLAAHGEGELFFLTRYGHQTPDAFDYAACTRDIYLVFGKESTGIPLPLLGLPAAFARGSDQRKGLAGSWLIILTVLWIRGKSAACSCGCCAGLAG